LLVLLTFVAYWPAFHAGFIWDDDKYVTANPLLNAPDGWWRIWFSQDSPSQYFPLTYSVFRLEYDWWGLLPAGYHGVNILVHALNAWLVWRLLERLAVPGAWLAAAIFAIHPVQVETVAWVSELKNLLSFFFMLLALLAWVAFLGKPRRAGWAWYAAALAGQALALTAKTTACTLPAALLLVLWLKHLPVTRVRIAQITPFLLLGALMGLVTMWWERHRMGTHGALFAYGGPERLIIAGHAFWFYLGELVWPVHLLASYPRWPVDPRDPLAYGGALAVVVLGLVIWRLRARMGRGPEVAFLFFGLTLTPLLGFIMLYTFLFSFVADHYQYAACLGPIALAAAALSVRGERQGQGRRWVQPLAGAALLLILGSLTWRQCGRFASSETLWRATLERNPSSWLAHVNLGEALVDEGRVDEAVAHWRAALKLNPGDALAWYDLGVAGSQAGRVEEAVNDYEKALEFEPDLTAAGDKLAWILATSPIPALRDGPKAVALARRTNQITGGTNPKYLGTLAAADAAVGNFTEAVAILQDALQMPVPANDPGITNVLQGELRFYEERTTFRDLSLTNAPAQ
jgi:tetratricopeptide (TPR) repeat protein